MRRLLTSLTLAAVALAPPVQAQEWPPRTVTIVVPFAAGGTTDMFARIFEQAMQTKIGSAFAVENKAGAGGNIGTAQVAKAAPDGATLLVGTVSTHAINPFLYKNIAHDTEKDLAVTSKERSPTAPDVPALTEALPGFEAFLARIVRSCGDAPSDRRQARRGGEDDLRQSGPEEEAHRDRRGRLAGDPGAIRRVHLGGAQEMAGGGEGIRRHDPVSRHSRRAGPADGPAPVTPPLSAGTHP